MLKTKSTHFDVRRIKPTRAIKQHSPIPNIAAFDVYAPIAGTVIAINSLLEEAPETINTSPYGEGWFFKMQPDNLEEVNGLMDVSAYEAFCESEEH